MEETNTDIRMIFHHDSKNIIPVK